MNLRIDAVVIGFDLQKSLSVCWSARRTGFLLVPRGISQFRQQPSDEGTLLFHNTLWQ